VLVIDDDPAARRVAKTFFAGDGHQVEAVPAQEGLDAALRAPFDAVIVDCRAASPTGASILDALLVRSDLRNRIIATADAPRGNSELARDVPCVGKPFNLKELGAAVRGLWGGKGSPSEPGGA